MPVDAFGYVAKTLDEVIFELQKVAENFPQLRDAPVWVDSGPSLYKPVDTISITPGPRGSIELKTMLKTAGR